MVEELEMLWAEGLPAAGIVVVIAEVARVVSTVVAVGAWVRGKMLVGVVRVVGGGSAVGRGRSGRVEGKRLTWICANAGDGHGVQQKKKMTRVKCKWQGGEYKGGSVFRCSMSRGKLSPAVIVLKNRYTLCV